MHPFLHVVEGLLISDGIRQDYASSAFVVGLCDVLESLLACSVPDLQLQAHPIDSKHLDLEVDSNSGNVVILEIGFAEAHEDIGLANATVSDDDELHERIMVRLVFSTYLIHLN